MYRITLSYVSLHNPSTMPMEKVVCLGNLRLIGIAHACCIGRNEVMSKFNTMIVHRLPLKALLKILLQME